MIVRKQGIKRRNAHHQRNVLRVYAAGALVVGLLILHKNACGRRLRLPAAEEWNSFAALGQAMRQEQRNGKRRQQQSVHDIGHIGHSILRLLSIRRTPAEQAQRCHSDG